MSTTAVGGIAGRSRGRLWRDILGLLKELWLAQPGAWLATLGLLIVGNARVGLYVTAAGGAVSALPGEPAGGHSVLFWLGVYIFARALEEFYWGLSPVVSAYLMDHGTFRMQDRVLERAAAAPLIQFEEGEFFAHLQRATAGTGERLIGVYNQLMQVSTEIIRVGAVAIALYVIQPLLVPLLVVGTIPSIWLQARVATALYQARRTHTVGDRIRLHLERLLTGRDAAAEVRLFGSAEYLIGRWRSLRAARSHDIVEAERRRAWSGALSGSCSGAAYAAALVLVTFLILRGKLSIGNYVTVAFGALWFEGMFAGLVNGVRALEEESQFLGDLFDFLRAARQETTLSDSPRAGERVRESGSPGILVEADCVSFAYPGSVRPVLHDISLRIAPGERVAIVGENGAGKTTLVRLLAGLYQPDRGMVRLEGVPLTPDRAVEMRRRVAAVFQDYACFQLTARESIGFGDLERLWDDAALAAAAKQADIASLLARLPDGLDTYVGREFGETDLSGGQWQRLALARAFFRQADLLVLDEPTAALDPLAELALFRRFAELVQGHTAIMISHRLGMARLADRVIVLEHGAIVEEGTHAALIAAGGRYARMFEAQAQWYR